MMSQLIILIALLAILHSTSFSILKNSRSQTSNVNRKSYFQMHTKILTVIISIDFINKVNINFRDFAW